MMPPALLPPVCTLCNSNVASGGGAGSTASSPPMTNISHQSHRQSQHSSNAAQFVRFIFYTFFKLLLFSIKRTQIAFLLAMEFPHPLLLTRRPRLYAWVPLLTNQLPKLHPSLNDIWPWTHPFWWALEVPVKISVLELLTMSAPVWTYKRMPLELESVLQRPPLRQLPFLLLRSLQCFWTVRRRWANSKIFRLNLYSHLPHFTGNVVCLSVSIASASKGIVIFKEEWSRQ